MPKFALTARKQTGPRRASPTFSQVARRARLSLLNTRRVAPAHAAIFQAERKRERERERAGNGENEARRAISAGDGCNHSKRGAGSNRDDDSFDPLDPCN